MSPYATFFHSYDNLRNQINKEGAMAELTTTNAKMQAGYELLAKQKYVLACDIWLETWDALKEIMSENEMGSIKELDAMPEWTQFPSNFVQDLEAELHNAGIDNPEYHQKRIVYCEDLLKYVNEDIIITGNTKRAIADAYFELGNSEECDRLYSRWLDEDPQWGWGYLGWAMCYESENFNEGNSKKAREIIERGLDETDVRDRLDVVDHALAFYEEYGGEAARTTELRTEFARLKAASPGSYTEHKAIPVTSDKIGRNDPCPCGSGKKYKKCHGKAVGE